MSIELSLSQERRLHSILDRGLEALHESADNISRSSPALQKNEFSISNASQESPRKVESPVKEAKKSSINNSELKALQEKLAFLESKLTKNSDSYIQESSSRKKNSSRNSNRPHSQTSSRESPGRISSAVRNESRERIRNIENSEREINKLERSITPNSASKKKGVSNSRQIEKYRLLVENERKLGEKFRKENETLKKEISKRDEMKNTIAKLQEDYNELAVSFERSEAVRKKQKELILQLKNEIETLNGGNIPDHIPSKSKKKTKKAIR